MYPTSVGHVWSYPHKYLRNCRVSSALPGRYVHEVLPSTGAYGRRVVPGGGTLDRGGIPFVQGAIVSHANRTERI